MSDIFDNKILCRKCNAQMKKAKIFKNGFSLRAVICDKCGEKAIHPEDKSEYDNFQELKNKIFKVKLRLVGNSYAVSIPKQIIDFMNEQEKIMDEIVSLCFEEAGKLSLIFDEDIIKFKKLKNKNK